jgi:hypothetical protein
MIKVKGFNIDKFTEAYLTCALWSSNDDHGKALDIGHKITDLARETLKKHVADCAAFQKAHWDSIASDPGHAGHDFWLTRNGHGAGFWDGDWPEPAATVLTDAAEHYGEVYLYIGDDGLIYSS